MKPTRLEQMVAQMPKKLAPEQGKQVISQMYEAYRQLCRNDSEKPPELISHLHKNIYPVVAAFRALMACGMSREGASTLAQAASLELMEAPAASIRRLCRIPGLYRMVPCFLGN